MALKWTVWTLHLQLRRPDTNYAVISDVEGYDDTNIMVTSKTTTGFQSLLFTMITVM